MNRLTHTLWSSLLQWMILLYVIMLLPLSVYSQTYSWKQVAPFPYYRAEHTLYGNNIYLVYGRIIESLNESNGRKTEIGTTPFFMTSSDGKTWNIITPKAVYPADKAGTGGCAAREEEIVPLKILFLKGSFITLARNVKKEQKIYRSEDGNFWYPTGIDATSMHFIKDRLIVEHNLTFSVSSDGKKWDTYGASFPDEPERHKNIKKEFRTVSIVAEDPSSVSFNGDSTRGYYTDSCYVVSDNDKAVGISRDGVHWRVVERPIFKNDTLIENVIEYTYENKRFVYVTSSEEELSFASFDGEHWKKIENKIDGSINDSGFANTIEMEDEPGKYELEKLKVLGMRFRFGKNDILEQSITTNFYHILFHNNQFLIPVLYFQENYSSNDGYTWQYVKWNADSSILSESDPYFKKNRVFVNLYVNGNSSSDESSTINAKDDEFKPTGYIKISKDRKKWDTVNVDSLIRPSNYFPELRKYSDGVIISTRDIGNWYSTDARRWTALDIKKSLADSCRAFANISAVGKDRKLYMFLDGTTKLSNDAGTQWFEVVNRCYNTDCVAYGNGHFVTAGKYGRIWVLEENK